MRTKSTKIKVTRRRVESRPGSVLILVIALLVLLALIGTAYLSSTQTERYTAHQNSINTEADLLMQGMVNSLNGAIANGLYGSSPAGAAYRPPTQEMPSANAPLGSTIVTPKNGYYNYDSTVVDPAILAVDPMPDFWLMDRVPTLPNTTIPATLYNATAANAPTWRTLSFPLFKDASGGYSFDAPFSVTGPSNALSVGASSAPIMVGSAASKGLLSAQPTSVPMPDGTTGPGMVLINNVGTPLGSAQIPPPQFVLQNGNPVPNGQILNNSNSYTALPGPGVSTVIYAGDTTGCGIADACFVKVPVGPIDGITYYVAMRTIDGNSAINASTAWTQTGDTVYSAVNSPTNYGFFRSGVGLLQLLNQNPPLGSHASTEEMNGLNTYRFGQPIILPYAASPIAAPTALTVTPKPDQNMINPPANFVWYSWFDEMENQMARRPGNTGYDSNGDQFQWLGLQQSAALAYKGCLLNSSAGPSSLEMLLPNELTNYPNARSTPYSPADVLSWYNDQFVNMVNFQGTNGFEGLSFPLRTIITASNPVSNAVPGRLGNTSSPTAYNALTAYSFGDWVTFTDNRSYVCLIPNTGQMPGVVSGSFPPTNTPSYPEYWAFVPFSSQPSKTSVNTATFEQLWLGFAQVMTDSVGVDPLNATSALNTTGNNQWLPPMQPGTVTSGAEPQLGMFRSVLRTAMTTSRPILTASQMVKLRAAIAAVNTMDLRDSDDDVTSAHIVLTDSSNVPLYDVEVYGAEKQPYIAEVVIQTNGVANDPGNYIAVELCNPYPVAMTLTNWQIGSINRTLPQLTLSTGVMISTVTIPAASNGVPGMLILEDGIRPMDITTTIEQNRILYPTATSSSPTAVAGLFNAAFLTSGTSMQPLELFLFRPRLAKGTQTTSTLGYDRYNENGNLSDNVPVDQIDFTGLGLPPPTQPTPPTWRYHYRRADDAQSTVGQSAWQFVFPGYYDPGRATTKGRYFNTSTESASAIIIDTGPQPLPCNLAGPTSSFGLIYTSSTTPGPNNPTYATCTIEVNNAHMAGPNAVTVGGTQQYPFGAFARNADMMQITFIGAYRIRPYSASFTGSNIVTELNSLSMDSALANDTTISGPAGNPALVAYAPVPNNKTTPAASNAFNEQIGRFCPVGDPSQTTSAAMLDFGTGFATGDQTQKKSYWHYHWTKKLFDYFTVQSPQDDYYPNYDPSESLVGTVITPKYPDNGMLPWPISNNDTSTLNGNKAGSSEDTVGVEGLININTAPVAVLAQLPFSETSGGYNPAINATIAKAIVAYRTANGPFQSITDLYRVGAFLSQNTGIVAAPAGPAQGVFSPGGIGASATTPVDSARYDFREKFLLLNNISNLITTRSDTFTCYILLQGWRNVGTSNPVMVVQRRVAFIVDRNGVTPSNNVPTNYRVPSN